MTSHIEILRDRFGLTGPVSLDETRPPLRNAMTRRVALYRATDAVGNVGQIFEKVSRNSPLWARTTPEAIFYERVLLHWPFMKAHTPELLGSRHGATSTTIFLEALPKPRRVGGGRPLSVFVRDMTLFLRKMHGSGAKLLASGALSRKTLKALDYDLIEGERSKVDHARYADWLSRSAIMPVETTGKEAGLIENLDALAEASRAAPRAICHLDLIGSNIFSGARGPLLIDWGQVRIAPAGFDYGSLLAGVMRRSEPRKFRNRASRLLKTIWTRAPSTIDREKLLMSAYYFLVTRALRSLDPNNPQPPPPNSIESIRLLVEPISAGRAAPEEMFWDAARRLGLKKNLLKPSPSTPGAPRARSPSGPRRNR